MCDIFEMKYLYYSHQIPTFSDMSDSSEVKVIYYNGKEKMKPKSFT